MPGTPRIIVLSEQLRGQSFDLTEEEYSIGRSEDCSICVPDPTISGDHCKLIRESDGSYTAHDNGSTNGTRINGVRIEAQTLVNSDILQVGGVEMLFDCEEKSVTSVLSTQTGINLEDTAGGLEVKEMANFSPFGSSSGIHRSENKKVLYTLMGVIGVLGVAVLVVLAILVSKLL